MNNIEIGEYVRTINSEIEKVILIYDNRYMNEDGNMTHFDEVKVHSKNIIDLIEVGDYVNGKEVIGKFREDFNENNEITLIVDTDYIITKITNKYIKTVLTHELYEQNCYKVGDIE